MNYTLKGKIAKAHPYQLDTTLTVEGAGAEAKATGEAIEKVKTAANNAQTTANEAKSSAAKANQDVANLKENVENLNESVKNLPAADHNGEIIRPHSIDFQPVGNAHGGYMDFHHPTGTEEDFSTRIAEYEKGKLTLEKHGENLGFIPAIRYQPLSLIQTEWTGENHNVKEVAGVKATKIVLFNPSPGGNNALQIRNNNVRVIAQEDNKLTFGCDTIPTENISIDVLVITI
jgi:hypothetical protein